MTERVSRDHGLPTCYDVHRTKL